MSMSSRAKRVLGVAIIFVLTGITVGIAVAQVSYGQPWFTSYSAANLGNGPANIVATYYDSAGVAKCTNTFPNVPVGGSVTVLQATESCTPALGSGEYSAVLSSDQPIAAVVNQQLGTQGSTSTAPPFSSYSGASQGSNSIVVPEVMYNWFGHYTELYIQNVGAGTASNIDVQYFPTTVGSCTTGAAGQGDLNQTANQYATKKVSQLSKTALGAPTVAGCTSFNGRFLGAALITSDQPVVVVANHHVQNKLFTYNGFNSSEAATKIILPAYMKNFYGFYASMTVANPDLVNSATVTLTYRSDASFSNPLNTSATATFVIPAGRSINRYDGPGASASQTDLAASFGGASNRFFGSVIIESNRPVVAIVNQESTAAAGAKAGAYNGMAASQGTQKVAVPLIQSAFYGFYTSLTIQTVDGTNATVRITYTSDNQYSSKLNSSKTYTMTTSGGFLNRYEGATASAAQSDLLDDAFWLSGGNRRFIGSAVIEVVSGPNIVAYVNSESTGATALDRQYTFNAFNITP
jgi:hypothetical protein